MEIPAHIRKDIEEYIEENPGLRLETDLTKHTAEELFQMWCTWNGLIGYARQISKALDSIRAFKKES